MAFVQKKIEVPAELAGRVDRVVQKLTELSRSQIRGLFSHGCIFVNDEPCDDGGKIVKAGDIVFAKYDAHQRYHEKPRAWEDEAFTILFEDRHIIVVDKAAGVLTVPAHPGDSNTLVEALARYFEHRGLHAKPNIVHRLDRDVSGVLVFGKTRAMAEELQRQFEARKPEREYSAIVKGRVAPRGTFKSRLATSKSLQRHSTHRSEGEIAITHYELRRVARGCSVVRVWLETGRRNQIRVHFAEAGHPVLGDPRYGAENSSHPQWKTHRLALHAAVLGFKHPENGKTLRFESPLPGAMRRFVGE